MEPDILGVLLAQRAQPCTHISIQVREQHILGDLGGDDTVRQRRPGRSEVVASRTLFASRALVA
ncbi:MAG: hypothetical protein ACOH17_15890 [Cellulomonas sp.]